LAYRSFIAGEAGRPREQASLAAEATALAREQGLEEAVGEVFIAAAVSLAARGEHEEALPLVDRGLGVLRALGHPIDLAYALQCRASMLRAVGDRKGATADVAEARLIVDACPDPGILREHIAASEASPRARARAPQSEELSERERVILRMLGG